MPMAIPKELTDITHRNRALSIRSRRDREPASGRHKFSISTFRGIQAPELSRKLTRLIKSENNAIGAYEAAGRERSSIAAQLSDWGESTEDDAISDISDKLGVMLAEIGEQEDLYAQNLEDSRGMLKHIRNMEASVQPSRDQRQKVTDEIAKLKYKDPNSTRLTTLEHELVRAEAQNLVAEAQLSNTTRTKLKEAYDIQLAATIERAEKQIILARHARRLLNFIDDSPVVPGDTRTAYDHELHARQVLEDAETDLRAWEPTIEPITSAANVATGTSDQEAESLVNATGAVGTSGDSMANDLPSASKQQEEPQTEKSEAEPVPY
ncbi:Sphingolipid long chain base-responsive protein LSP1 [Penicillium argentinense]|uniref:Sphingolipid long chain base-responsive protein LSP1 n=1 Tax=Penicillium argentinense TaxID=1131581 RepID=A0A9W9FM07_9EURO|nr:Sphingolipid long chain base-responsive protein LSP1 [Penicillium argentinense]KAJ5102642.1 Sphingolipid long chain base-responsive protein LSP1 [Penicillium argentinense]